MSAGSDLAALRRQVDHTCRCGTKFKAIKGALYCSNRCKQMAARARKLDGNRAADIADRIANKLESIEKILED